MKQQEPFIILSAERPEYTVDGNAARSAALARQLAARDLDFMRVVGSYNGQQEQSFLVLAAEDSPEEALVRSLARRYGQESVLSVCGSRIATLHYLKPKAKPVRLGNFHAITEAEAMARPAWTRDNAGQYWSTTP